MNVKMVENDRKLSQKRRFGSKIDPKTAKKWGEGLPGGGGSNYPTYPSIRRPPFWGVWGGWFELPDLPIY